MSTWIVDTDNGLKGRAAPVTGAVRYVRPRGFKLGIVRTERHGGKVWGVTSHGTWYCLAYCRAYVARAKRANGRAPSPVPGYHVSTPYGLRRPGLWRTKGYHTGDDYASPQGSRVVANLPGVVHYRQDAVLGRVMVLYADNGRSYWFCHLSRRAAADGARVGAGQLLGYVGQTGTGAHGPHLHFEDHRGHSLSWWAKDRDPNW